MAPEYSPFGNLSSRAVALHTILHHKHTFLLNSGFVDACGKSYEYQRKCSQNTEGSQPVRGYRIKPTPDAQLDRWYALVREKRAIRQEFLRAMLKVFEIKDANATTQEDVNFVRYMAENFASFDYRSQDDIFTVLKVLTRELAETGAQVLERIAPGNLLAQPKSSQRQEELTNAAQEHLSAQVLSSKVQQSIAIFPDKKGVFDLVAKLMVLRGYFATTLFSPSIQ